MSGQLIIVIFRYYVHGGAWADIQCIIACTTWVNIAHTRWLNEINLFPRSKTHQSVAVIFRGTGSSKKENLNLPRQSMRRQVLVFVLLSYFSPFLSMYFDILCFEISSNCEIGIIHKYVMWICSPKVKSLLLCYMDSSKWMNYPYRNSALRYQYEIFVNHKWFESKSQIRSVCESMRAPHERVYFIVFYIYLYR